MFPIFRVNRSLWNMNKNRCTFIISIQAMAKDAFSFSGGDALNYDKYLGPLLFEPAALEVLQFLGDPATPSVLEISSGTGRLTRLLKSYFSPETKLIASDISIDMLDLARQKLNNDSIEYVVADAQQLPFEDNAFDLVICQFGLMFLPDKLKGFQEALRVLKPGGRYIFSTWDRLENIPLNNLIINETIVSFFNGTDKDRFHIPFSMHDRENLLSYLKRAGFKKQQLFHLTFKAGQSSPEDVVNGFLLKHPLGRVVLEKDPAALEPMAAMLTEKISRNFGSPHVLADLQAYVGVGEK